MDSLGKERKIIHQIISVVKYYLFSCPSYSSEVRHRGLLLGQLLDGTPGAFRQGAHDISRKLWKPALIRELDSTLEKHSSQSCGWTP